MGVQGLWQLLETTSRPVTLESLEGKVLAVDVSIWLHQAVRGMRDAQGNVPTNAHLLVLFHRICKLLFYRIKPVFVFDGGVPQLKKQTLVARRQRREIASNKCKRTADKMLSNYMRSHALHTVMSASGKQNQLPPRPKLGRVAAEEPDLYQLPPMPADSDSQEASSQSQDTWEDRQEDLASFTPYTEDMEKMDIDSGVFQALPLEIQHELITELREKGKKSSWKKISQLPKHADDFSSYQISKLLNKGKMTQRLDKLRKDMSIQNTGVLASMLDVENSLEEMHAGRVMSEDTEHYMLVKTKPSNKNDTNIEKGSTSSSNGANQEIGLKEKLEENESPQELLLEGKICQSNNKAPWVSDTALLGEDSPLSYEKSKEIAESVRSFFAKNNVQCSQETNLKSVAAVSQGQMSVLESKGQPSNTSLVVRQTVSGSSKDRDIVVLSDNDSTPSSADDIEIIDVKKGRPGKSMQSLFTTTIDKFVHSALSQQHEENDAICDRNDAQDKVVTVSKQTPSGINRTITNKDDIMVTDQVKASGGSSKHARSKHQELDKSNKIQTLPNEGQNKLVVPMFSSLLDKLVTSAVLQETEPNRNSSLKTEVLQVNDVRSVETDSEDSDDDFVEVPALESTKEELFTPETLIPSKSVSDVSLKSSSPVQKEEDSVKADEIMESEEEINSCSEKNEGVRSDAATESDATDRSDVADESDIAMETSYHAVHDQEAQDEWAGMNVANLAGIQAELESERLVLATERGRQERVAISITDVMYAESKELLHLFGLPFIVSPQEAEAQCAYLDHTDLTEGTITDDSDIWLFGGCHVYKNFFTKGKDVEYFRSVDFDKHLSVLDREKLIQLAYLLGSDYTQGIPGVGWITAMEVLSEFPGKNLEGLRKYKEWWDKAHKQLVPPAESGIRTKLRKLTIHPGFPNPQVTEAYLNPVVDESQEEFSWGSPDLDLLRNFAAEKFGWNKSKTDETVLPVIRKLNEKRVQSKINQFFPMEHNEPRQIKSKRLQKVLKKLGNPHMELKELTAQGTSQNNRGRTSKKHKLGTANRKGEIADCEVKGQGLFSRNNASESIEPGKKSSVTSEEVDSDVSDEYRPPTKVNRGFTGLTRRTGRMFKKVIKQAESEHSDADQQDGNGLIGQMGSVSSRQLNKCSTIDIKGAARVTEAKSSRGRGKSQRGNISGKGKGRVGVKGKGKLLAKKGSGKSHSGNNRGTSGPKLSESSSGDSD